MANYNREVAYRVFSDELRESTVVPREEGEYAVQYTRLPTGHNVNRLFVVGALIDKEDIGQDSEYWKLTVSDPKGSFKAYIGTYQDNALAAIEHIDVPSFVAMTCKIKSNEYDGKTYFNLAPESINEVDEKTYDIWCEETERLTKERQNVQSNN